MYKRQLYDSCKAFYAPGNMVLAAAGDTTMEQILAACERHGLMRPRSTERVQRLWKPEPMTLAAAHKTQMCIRDSLYTRVLDRDGNIYLENNSTSYQALTPDTAYVMNRLLKNVLYSSVGTAGGRYPNSNGMEAFGKTLSLIHI